MEYDNCHRTFLQAIMQAGVILDQDASELCVKIFDARINISKIAALINNKLAPLAMSMKSGICEMTGDKYWSVVGTNHEDAVTILSEFSQSQRAFLRMIYSEIIGADDGCISSTNCLNLSSTLDTKLSINEADQFVKTMIKKKWLYCKNGYIYMGIRSIVELMPYFRATYQDNFHNCFLCKEIIFHGQKCENCEKMFHNYCLAKYISRQKHSKCPQCKHVLDVDDIPDDVMASQNITQDESMDICEDTDVCHSMSTSRKSKKRARVH